MVAITVSVTKNTNNMVFVILAGIIWSAVAIMVAYVVIRSVYLTVTNSEDLEFHHIIISIIMLFMVVIVVTVKALEYLKI